MGKSFSGPPISIPAFIFLHVSKPESNSSRSIVMTEHELLDCNNYVVEKNTNFEGNSAIAPGESISEQPIVEPVRLHPVGRGDDDFVVTTKDDPLPLVPEGRYQVQYVRMEKVRYFGGWKLYVWFRICDGPYIGTDLYRAFNYSDKPISHATALHKTLVMLHGRRVSKKTRLSPKTLFMNKVLEVDIRTVTQDRNQNVLPQHQQYSVIDAITRVLVGGYGT